MKQAKDIFLRTLKRTSEDNIDVVAAGVAFYSLLSVPFLLTATVSIYGLLADPAAVQQQMEGLQGILPAEATALVSSQLAHVAEQPGNTLTITLLGSVLFALWSGSKATRALMSALNIAYGTKENRGLLSFHATAIALTTCGVLGAILCVAMVVGIPVVIDKIGLPKIGQTISEVLRWPILATLGILGLGLLYRYAPSGRRPSSGWLSAGALVATTLWLVGSGLFSWYISQFGTYNQTYGSLGAVIITLLWFYLSAFVVLLGAELNSALEQRGKTIPIQKENKAA